VVVPENSKFKDGSRLSWANATEVSLAIKLPNITFTDYPVLAVESLMAADGSVMQVAAGIYPNNTKWLAYGWYIRHVQSYPQTYDWILNSSKPEMPAGAPVSLSIYLSQGRWRCRIEDLSTNDSAVGDYAVTVPPTLKVGDQEVFALESYSTSDAVFAHMGNLTLETLRINGRQIAVGWYEYGGWNTGNNPLFVVGGLYPPSSISLQEATDATLVWSYQQWLASGQEEPQSSPFTILAGVPAMTTLVVFSIAYAMRRRTRS
jgi:hypothetical protein